MLQLLLEDEVKWGKKLDDVQAKAREVSAEQKSLQDFLDVVILLQKYLEKEILDLTNELVSTSGTSFEKVKEQIFFWYPTVDLGLLDPFKVVRDGVMVDEGDFPS